MSLKFLKIEYERFSDNFEPINIMKKIYPDKKFPDKSYAFKETYYVRVDYIEELFSGPEGFSIFGSNMRKLFSTMWHNIVSIELVYAEDIIKDLQQMPNKEKENFYRDLKEFEKELLEESKKKNKKEQSPGTFI